MKLRGSTVVRIDIRYGEGVGVGRGCTSQCQRRLDTVNQKKCRNYVDSLCVLATLELNERETLGGCSENKEMNKQN